MSRRLGAVLLAAAVIAGCGGGGGKTDADRVALDRADAALAKAPRDPVPLGAVVRIAYAGASHRYDVDTGGFSAGARPYLTRAAAVWPRYLAAVRGQPAGTLAEVMVLVYGDGLGRPAEAARAARLAATAHPTAAGYLQLTVWAARAGDSRGARLAGQKALELAAPRERERIRAGIRQALRDAP